MQRPDLLVAALLGALGVGLGAIGAHALHGRVTPSGLEIWRTAVFYHLLHTLVLLLLALAQPLPRFTRLARGLFVTGILVFSGSLYLLVLLNVSWLGTVTPVGGIALIAGWVTLAAGACMHRLT